MGHRRVRVLWCVAFTLALSIIGCGGDSSSTDSGMGDSTVPDDMAIDDQGPQTDIGSQTDTGTEADAGDDLGASCTGPDTDGDGVPNACDRCLTGADQLDADLDTIPDACDECPGFSDLVDTDGDGVSDGCDICPAGDDLIDGDGDGVPLACDVCDLGPNGADADGDGTPDACDVCAGSPDGPDADDDGVPDACDLCAGEDDILDADGDGVPDGCDVCSGHDDAIDTDSDGTADGCDCEPTLAIAHPGLTEVCDGLDNDCAGGVDNGLAGCAPRCRPDMVDWDLDGTTCESGGRVIFVNGALTTGANDGTSWANAHRTLEAAIVDAETTPAGRKQIWIAQGTYQPSRDVDPTASTIRAFLVPASTALLGGFVGTEVRATQATPATVITTLTYTNIHNRRIIDVRQADTRLDGLVINEGGGRGISVSSGALLATRLDLDAGPAVASTTQVNFFMEGGTATLRDVIIQRGVIGVDAVAGTIVCERCLLRGHTSGGALSGASALRITAGNVTLRNSVVYQNTSFTLPTMAPAGLSAGVAVIGAAGRFRAENTTIAGNSGGRFISISAQANAGLDVRLGAATVVNTIIRNNDGNTAVNATAISSSVQGIAGACAPMFADPTTLAGLALGAGSPCIDAGDASMSQGSVDVLGAPRIQGGGLDLGAIETPP